ncbi:MAG: hypothetical protein EP341_01725 [Sphingomonadales bacterium]|nr:MAG: hypothetical protein EP341_01725 [Sphingomonadales bacterium]
MSLESIYFLSQIIAVIAIIGSLLFVGFQVQQSRKMERAAAQRELLYRVSDFTRHYAEMDPEIVLCFLDYESAKGATQGRFGAYISEFIFITEAALNMRRDGFFTEGTWQGIEGGALAMLRTPGGAQWWEYGKRYIGFEIVEHLERRLGEIDPETPDILELFPSLRKGIAEAEAQEIRSAQSTHTD